MNLVREHINFERGLDPKKAMGIGYDKYILNKIEELIKKTPQKGGPGITFFPEDQYYNDDNNELNYSKVLQTLAAYGELEIIKYLLKKGVDINGYEYKPLRAAIHFNHSDVVKYFLSLGAHITKTHIKVARKTAPELVDLLIKEFHKQEHEKNPEGYNTRWAKERIEKFYPPLFTKDI